MSRIAQRVIEHLLMLAAITSLILAHYSLITFNSRLFTSAVIVCCALVICSRWLRDSTLVVSPLDFGWLPYILLTGLTVIFSPFPRRSVELWGWHAAIQIPVVYASLYIFRRGWAERSIYRALLIIIGYLYYQAFLLTQDYYAWARGLTTEGIIPPGFRLFGILNHPNILAMVVAVTTPCIVGYIFMKLRWWERAICSIWLIGATITLYSTASRTGTIATFIGCAAALGLALLAHPAELFSRVVRWGRLHRAQATGLMVASVLILVVGLVGVIYIQSNRPYQDDGGGRSSFWRSALQMFVASPIVGKGVGSYVFTEEMAYSIPPHQPIIPHAHNIIFAAMSESGLAGLIGLLAMVVASAWVSWQSWRNNPRRRALIAGALGGLIAFVVFGMLDVPMQQTEVYFLAALLLGFVAAGLPAPHTTRRRRVVLIVIIVWGVALLSALLVIPYAVQWRVTGTDSPTVSNLDAAQQLDQVNTWNPNDGLMLLQTAYKWGYVAAEKPDELPTAIERFEQAIPYDPYLGMHRLNLSVLYEQAKRTDDALRLAQEAAERAHDDPLALLNLALLQEAKGDSAASDTYRRTLEANPQWQTAGFWQENDLRRAVLEQFLSSDKAAFYKLVGAGDYEGVLKLKLSLERRSYVEGLMALKSGDLDTAYRKIKQGIVTGTGDVLVDAWFGLGDVAQRRGNTDEMLQDYEHAYRLIAKRGLFGYGTQGDYGYAVLSFWRYGEISDYLPGVVRLDATPERAERLKVLAKAFKAKGNKADVEVIYRLIGMANPSDGDVSSGVEPF